MTPIYDENAYILHICNSVLIVLTHKSSVDVVLEDINNRLPAVKSFLEENPSILNYVAKLWSRSESYKKFKE